MDSRKEVVLRMADKKWHSRFKVGGGYTEPLPLNHEHFAKLDLDLIHLAFEYFNIPSGLYRVYISIVVEIH